MGISRAFRAGVVWRAADCRAFRPGGANRVIDVRVVAGRALIQHVTRHHFHRRQRRRIVLHRVESVVAMVQIIQGPKLALDIPIISSSDGGGQGENLERLAKMNHNIRRVTPGNNPPPGRGGGASGQTVLGNVFREKSVVDFHGDIDAEGDQNADNIRVSPPPRLKQQRQPPRPRHLRIRPRVQQRADAGKNRIRFFHFVNQILVKRIRTLPLRIGRAVVAFALRGRPSRRIRGRIRAACAVSHASRSVHGKMGISPAFRAGV